MKPLVTEFESKGFIHSQIKREGDIALFKRTRDKKDHYEVIRVKSHDGFKIPGTELFSDPAEYHPGDKAWGNDGWTYTNKCKAEEKFNELVFDVKFTKVLKAAKEVMETCIDGKPFT